MTPEQLKEYHLGLNEALDELVQAYFEAHPTKLPSTTTVLELIQWSKEMAGK